MVIAWVSGGNFQVDFEDRQCGVRILSIYLQSIIIFFNLKIFSFLMFQLFLL